VTTNRREGSDREAVEIALRGLDHADLAAARWYGGKGRTIEGVALDEAFALDARGSHVLAIVRIRASDDVDGRYLLALTGDPLRPADPGDGTWRALAAAMAEGRSIAALPTIDETGDGVGPVTAALVCRPGRAMPPGVATALERDLGADQSNTSVVLGDIVLVKAYRRVQPGLNPELELVAYLSEQAGFPAVPPLAGYAEVVSARAGVATIAIAQAFVADGSDAYESIAETLTSWLLAPGEVSVEFATEVAADLGTLTAGMHAALADARNLPGFESREATGDDLRRWGADAREQLDRALQVTDGDAARVLRDLAPRIAEAFTIFDALARAPLLTRIHADYHLGQVLIAPDGFRVVDFEGEPFRTPDERRALQSPLRDVASMLRSIDHVGRSAERRALGRNGGALEAPGLDVVSWLGRARERFLEAYRAGLRETGTPLLVDPALIRAFEIEKECYEFVYASTFLPSWIWAPTEGMRGLFEGAAR
jgi:maltose alpha-D-glucosyltransferase/alpha-amylase